MKYLCTNNKDGRLIERSEHATFIEQNKLNIAAHPTLYKKQQTIVEHPYGILKRQWGFYYIMTKKTKKHASADVGLMFNVYNLRRIMKIVDKNVFKKFLEELGFLFFEKTTSPNKNKIIRMVPIFEESKTNYFFRVA